MINIRRQKARRRRIKAGLIMLGILVVVIFFFFNEARNNVLPPDIKAKLDFNAIIPSQSNSFTGYALNKESFKLIKNSEDSILSYKIVSGNDSITMTQQIYPDILIYDKLTTSIKPYAEVNTTNGTVTLGRPDGAKGSQVAVAKTNDLLVFAYPSKDLSNREWREIFNSLEGVK